MVAFVGAGLLTAVAVSGAGATSRPLHRSTRAQMPHRAGSAVTSASDFGDSVAISGTTAVVGAVGAAYIFTEGSGGWPSTPTVTLSDPADSTGDLFGASVAISGSVAVVGASGAGATPGSAYVYVDGTSGWPTTPTATLTDPKQVHSDLFGTSVAVSNGTIVVGAKGVKEGRGAVYIYQQGASGWPSQPTVSLKDPGKAPGDAFGQAVAVSGTTTVVGAYQGKAAGGGSYVYSEHGSHWSSRPSAVLNDPASTAGDEFGEAVDVSGSTVVIAAPDSANGGAVYFYVKGSSRWPTTPMTALSDPLATAADAFGWSVSLAGAVAVVGAPGTASQSGSAYVYDETTSGWPTTPTQTLTDPGGLSLDAFGDAIALSGTTLLIGAPNTDSSAGAAYFYT